MFLFINMSGFIDITNNMDDDEQYLQMVIRNAGITFSNIISQLIKILKSNEDLETEQIYTYKS